MDGWMIWAFVRPEFLVGVTLSLSGNNGDYFVRTTFVDDGELANTSYEESEKSYRKNSDRSRSDYYTQRNRLQSDRERYEYDEYYRQYES